MDMVTVIGLSAATCTTIAFVPQVYKTIKTKQTEDLSLGMFSLMAVGIMLWFVYGVFQKDVPVIVANATVFLLVSVILYMIITSKKK